MTESIYHVVFLNHDQIYEIYVKSVAESNMFGFLEIGEFVFGKNTSLVVDPSEERLKLEFEGVERTYIPMHSVIRIDEVQQEGVAKIRENKATSNTVSLFPKGQFSRPDRNTNE